MPGSDHRDAWLALSLIGLYVGPILVFVGVAAWEAWG